MYCLCENTYDWKRLQSVAINHVSVLQSSKQSWTLTHCIVGGRTNAHSQSGSGVDATFGTALACGSPWSGLVTLRESAVEVEFSGFAGKEEEEGGKKKRETAGDRLSLPQDILYTSG